MSQGLSSEITCLIDLFLVKLIRIDQETFHKIGQDQEKKYFHDYY